MRIDSLSGIDSSLQKLIPTEKKSESGFQNILGDALENYKENSEISNKNVQGVLTGDSNDLHNIMVDMEKSSLSLQFMMQVRNKVLESYNEVMRMQV